MKRLDYARKRGRALREAIGLDAERLQERLEQYAANKYQVRIVAYSAEALRHSKAETLLQKRQLRYDKKLDDTPAEKLFVFAHELGHLELHQKSIGPHAIPNRLRDSKYALSGSVGALARYNKRDAEEVEANAFAKEFLCPVELVFADWGQHSEATIAGLAEKWGVAEEIVQIQLAEALFDLFLNSDASDSTGKTRTVLLNDEQRAAAIHVGSPALVDAGPGTGKTATLVMRVEHLLQQQTNPVAPDQILILTFSNEAAGELRERIEQRFDAETANAIAIHTFHSFGHACLLSFAHELAEDYLILDEVAQEEIVNELLGQTECEAIVALYDLGETARLAVEQINFLKDRMSSADEVAQAIAGMPSTDPRAKQKAEQLLQLWHRYEEKKAEQKAVDFSDLILLALKTFHAGEQLVTELRRQYQHVLVDEFQDVSLAMIQLLELLCGEQNPPWVVGDVRQAIYRFRGADPVRNQALFKELFPQAKPFDLRLNYRSSAPIIEAANQMATLLEAPEHRGNEFRAFWQAGKEHQAFGETPVQILCANSDAAEQAGIAALVEDWLGAGVEPGQIAILARRNIDVRNIVLALGARNIKAVAGGLITPEGPAGDLAVAMTLIDAPAAALPRVIYALGKGRYEPKVLNEVIRFLLHETQAGESAKPQDSGAELVAEYRRLFTCLQEQKHNSDAFAQLCAFLFDGSGYLRNCLNEANDTVRALALSEIITTLTQAAGYRFSHRGLSPRTARLKFAQHFRDNLAQSKPAIAAPNFDQAAVRVMTCHASKGLEFPCVIVAGQTLNQNKPHWWLPPTLLSIDEEDRKQADSLLFVGLTRAQRTAIVTYATAKTVKGRQRELPGLLGRWHACYGIPLQELPECESAKGLISAAAVWGQRARAHLPVRHLDKSVCGVATYLEKFLGVNFPQATPVLYPAFTVAIRRAFRKLVVQAQREQKQVSATDAEALFLDEFQRQLPERSRHSHQELYERVGKSFSRKFAAEYAPHPGAVEFLHWPEGEEELLFDCGDGLLPLRLDLITCLQDEQGGQHALLYRRESLSEKDDTAWNWSDLEARKRVSFVVLRHRYPAIQFWAFSGTDGQLKPVKPHRQPAKMDEDAVLAIETLLGFTEGRFVAQTEDYKCGRCPVRVSCPHWLNALTAVFNCVRPGNRSV